MKRWLVAVMVAALLLPWLPARARAEETVTIVDSGSLGGGVYWYIGSDRVLYIYGSGSSTSSSSFSSVNSLFDSVVIEDGVTGLGSNLFLGCTIVDISFPETLLDLGSYTFYRASIGDTIILPSKLEIIGSSCFAQSSITAIDIPSTLTFLGLSVFNGLPLTSITLPSTLTNIGYSCFGNCTSLQSVLVLASDPPAVNQTPTNLFEGCPTSLQIVVPAGSVSAYEAAAGWNEYAAWIVGGVSSGGGAGDAGGDTGGSTTTGSGTYYMTVKHTSLDDYYLDTDLQFWVYWFFGDGADSGIDHSVTWSVSGATSNETTIDDSGLLHIGEHESNLYLTVTATSVALPSLQASSTIKITKMTEEEANTPTEPTSDAAVLDAISDLEDDISQVSDAVETLPNQITDGMSDLMDQEQQEAQTQGETLIDDIIEIIPDHSEDFLTSLQTLADALGYTGTDAVLKSPVIKIPAVGSLFPETVLLESQDIDFGEWFQKMPDAIMALVRALFDMAIVYYCAKELLALVGGFVNGFVGFDQGMEDYNE